MKKFFIIILLFLKASSAFGCVRVDIGDRSPEEVYKKSLRLGASLAPAKVTGAIWTAHEQNFNGKLKELNTGIVLDSYTVLTCAHTNSLEKLNDILFNLGKNAQGAFNEGEYSSQIKHVFIHDTFKCGVIKNNEISSIDNEIHINDFPISTFQDISFHNFKETELFQQKEFSGVNLAILKLDTPLPLNLPYPDLLDSNDSVDKQYGIPIGFGRMKLNNQENGPILVSSDILKAYSRHVISCTFSSISLENYHPIFFGDYRGLLVNGNESFIPNEDMIKTEALPVEFDSGSPFLIKEQNTYKLAGIYSGTNALYSEIISDKNIRNLLDGLTQPIFPIWEDIRPHKEWIKKHMGPL